MRVLEIGSIVEINDKKGIIVDVPKGSNNNYSVWCEEGLSFAPESMLSNLGRKITFKECMTAAGLILSPSPHVDIKGIIENQKKRMKGNPEELTVLTYIAIQHILPDGTIDEDMPEYTRIHDIIVFLRNNYGVYYADGSRETIRKTAIKWLLEEDLIESNSLPKQSPRFGYRQKNR